MGRACECAPANEQMPANIAKSGTTRYLDILSSDRRTFPYPLTDDAFVFDVDWQNQVVANKVKSKYQCVNVLYVLLQQLTNRNIIRGYHIRAICNIHLTHR